MLLAELAGFRPFVAAFVVSSASTFELAAVGGQVVAQALAPLVPGAVVVIVAGGQLLLVLALHNGGWVALDSVEGAGVVGVQVDQAGIMVVADRRLRAFHWSFKEAVDVDASSFVFRVLAGSIVEGGVVIVVEPAQSGS